jgi:hypothetical protein
MIRSRTCSSTARIAGAAAAIALWASAAVASAEGAVDPVAAEALFKSARALVEAGDYAAGCPKFEASLALNPSASTLLNIAKCHEHDGKIATAWSDYNRARVLNHETRGAERQQALEAVAAAGIAAIEPRLPKLRIVVDPAPAGLKLARDGGELPAAALGEALPADPGTHQVTAIAPGYRAEQRSVVLVEGKTAVAEIALAKLPPGESGLAPGDAGATPPAPVGPAKDAGAKGGVPAWAWGAGGAGVVLAAVGAVFLADDLSAISALRSRCHTDAGGTWCENGYDYAGDNARKNRDLGLALGLGGAGLVGIGAAIVGIATAPKKADPAVSFHAAPWAGPSGAGAVIAGAF